MSVILKFLGAGIVVCAAVSFCTAVRADSSEPRTTVGLHLGSWHSAPGFNNANPGAYIVHNGWTVGGYYNSLRKASLYAGYTLESPEWRGMRAGLTVGAITGYYKSPAPLVAPSVSYRWNADWSARVFYLPKVRFTGSHVIHAAIERKF